MTEYEWIIVDIVIVYMAKRINTGNMNYDLVQNVIFYNQLIKMKNIREHLHTSKIILMSMIRDSMTNCVKTH